jgi:hypothetical protein
MIIKILGKNLTDVSISPFLARIIPKELRYRLYCSEAGKVVTEVTI